MLEKGELSFIFLWVLNPIVILCYQNCSSTSMMHSRANVVVPIERRAEASDFSLSDSARRPACFPTSGAKVCAE
jgi:hypothetical protein